MAPPFTTSSPLQKLACPTLPLPLQERLMRTMDAGENLRRLQAQADELHIRATKNDNQYRQSQAIFTQKSACQAM